MSVNNDLEKLIENLPFPIQTYLSHHRYKDELIEIVLDLGRRPEARFNYGPEYLSLKTISWQDIDYTTQKISKFSNENRAGIERTLHRISCIRNRQFLINGLTCRIGRAIFGTISTIRDLLESEKSILILGRPGVGKTTIIREIARVLADEMEQRVIIIDTSNEIGGDSDIPHFGIGRARRMQVKKAEFQHQIMIEAVENHMPQVIIIDEIGTEFEVLAARTIAEKGVKLIGTTHGNCLENLVKNPILAELIGGIQYVTLSDDEAKRRGTQKSILERKSYPTFELVIEINSLNSWTIHEDIVNTIDLLLRTNLLKEQLRQNHLPHKIKIKYQDFNYYSKLPIQNFTHSNLINQNSNSNNCWTEINQFYFSNSFQINTKSLIVYSYVISKNLLKEIMTMPTIKMNLILTKDIQKASLIIGLKKHLRNNFKLKQLAYQKNIPIYSLNKFSIYQLLRLLSSAK